jgi:hypothetical protein
LEKEAAEVPQRDPAATEVLCRPEVLCGKRKQQRYPNGTLLQQRYSADQRYSVGKGSVLKKKKNILKETSDQQRYSADQRYSVGKGSSRGTPTGPCCNRGTLQTRGTLLEKEAC